MQHDGAVPDTVQIVSLKSPVCHSLGPVWQISPYLNANFYPSPPRFVCFAVWSCYISWFSLHGPVGEPAILHGAQQRYVYTFALPTVTAQIEGQLA